MNDADRPEVPTLEQVRLLNLAVIEADAAIEQAKLAVNEAEQRRQPLRDRLDALDCDGCNHQDFDPALSDALVADPTAAPDVEAITAAVSAARKAQDVHNAQKGIIQQAIDKIGEEVAAAVAQLASAQQARETAWMDFVIGAHLHLGQRLIDEFDQLRQDVIEPMLALQKLGNPSLVDRRAPRLDGDFRIVLGRYETYTPLGFEVVNAPHPVASDEPIDRNAASVPRPHPWRFYDEVLYPLPARKAELVKVQPIDRFRAALEHVPAKKRAGA